MKQTDDLMLTSEAAEAGHREIQIVPDVFYYTDRIVNIVMVGDPRGSKWVLIDTGMPGSTDKIIDIASRRFLYDNRPSAIILTHGHFDHVGNIAALIDRWQTPVYAHPGEFAYLSGQQDYHKPHSTVRGRSMRTMSSIYFPEFLNISPALLPLPHGGNIPELPGWNWLHTPGHSPGHVSLFRESDRTLIAGDAFVTVRMDSFYKIIFQQAEINGPPSYFTTDWDAAFESVKKLEALKPQLAITGHGPAMRGEELSKGLKELVDEFNDIAVPKYNQ